MIAPQPRRLVTAGSLSLALLLAAPAAAFADPGDEPKGKGDRGTSERAKNDKSNGSSSRESRPSGSSGSTGPRDEKPSGSASDRDREARRGGSSDGRGASGTGRAEGGDPRGNNGTIKIDGVPFDDGLGNEPHVGCVFSLDFYGFDAADAATISFTGHAPTGGGLLHSQHSTISDDPAGGGQDRDATLTFSVSDQLSELLAVEPHAQQGWHVKVAVDVDGAPGGAKQKVFWISCPPSAAVAGTSTDAASGDAGTTTTTGGSTTEAVTITTAGSPTAIESRQLPLSALPPTFGEGAAEITGSSQAAARGEGAAQAVSARGAVGPRVLPFTGTQAVTALLVAGLGALGVGALAARLGRRSEIAG